MWPTLRSLFAPRIENGLVSRATILILAVLLFGMGLGRGVAEEHGYVCFVFGTFGIFAYLAFNSTTLLRLRRQHERRVAAIRAADVEAPLDSIGEPEIEELRRQYSLECPRS